MPSGWIFLKYEAAESSVQPLSYSLLLDLVSFHTVTLTNQQLPQKEGGTNWGSLLSHLPSRMLAQVIFPLQSCKIAKSSAQLLSCSASQPCMAEETPSAWRGSGISDSLLCISLSPRLSLQVLAALRALQHFKPSCFIVSYSSFLVVLGRLLVWYKHCWRWSQNLFKHLGLSRLV